MKIFLSGGTKSNWRSPVREAVPGAEWFDPTDLPSGRSMDFYAREEVKWLDQSDAVFFYFERDNPSGLGSAFEIGYAHAKGKIIIFVDEKRTNHTDWLAAHCNFTFYDLQSAVEKLKELLQAKRAENDGSSRLSGSRPKD